MVFTANTSITAPTLVFLNTALYYNNVLPTVRIEPESQLSYAFVDNNIVQFVFSANVDMGTMFAVTITPT